MTGDNQHGLANHDDDLNECKRLINESRSCDSQTGEAAELVSLPMNDDRSDRMPLKRSDKLVVFFCIL